MKKKILFLLILFIPFMVSAEEIKMEWTKEYDDGINNIFATSDGGYLAAGSKEVYNDGKRTYGDALIRKYDKNANIMFNIFFDDKSDEEFKDVIETNDGNFVAIGRVTPLDEYNWKTSNTKAIIIKYDSSGKILWKSYFDGNNEDYFYNIVETKNGDYIVIGSTKSTDIDDITLNGEDDTLIVKYDKDGNMIWKKNWGGSFVHDHWYWIGDYFNDIALAEDDSFIIIGNTFTNTSENQHDNTIVMLKYNKDGTLLWEKTWKDEKYRKFSGVTVNSQNEIIVVGKIEKENCSGGAGFITKFDINANKLWQNDWCRINSDDDHYIDLIELLNGESVALGFAYNGPDFMHAYFLMKYNRMGEEIEQIYLPENSQVYKLILTTENNILILGDKFYNYSIKYDLENATNENNNGTSTLEQQGRYGIVKPTPNEGYEVDKIIVKDKSGNVLDVEVTKQEDGTYSFELYTDVSVEVLFKEKLVNPKTGVSSFIGVMFTLMLIGISSFFMIRNCNNSYEL